jgi:sulfite exporter TauE/SafE
MNLEAVFPIVTASLLGSLHCAAMCGGLVGALAGSRPGEAGKTRLCFHLGRGGVYVALGAVAGALGSAIDLAGVELGLGRFAGVLAGALVVLVGLRGLLAAEGVRVPAWLGSLGIESWLGRRVAHGRGAVHRALWLGAAAALLPCGWLYAFVLAAGGTGSVLSGGLVMAAFWLGTVPALVGVGVLARHLTKPLVRHAPTLTAALLVCLGLGTIFFRINIPAAAFASVRASWDAGHTTLPEGAPPCH